MITFCNATLKSEFKLLEANKRDKLFDIARKSNGYQGSIITVHRQCIIITPVSTPYEILFKNVCFAHDRIKPRLKLQTPELKLSH